jgi:monovalent cation:H+ antiporter-2, CPA2 family
MLPDPVIFRDLAYVFVAAVLGGAVAWLARQPLILGYVAGGILIGPFTPGPVVSDVHTFEVVAEIGVVLLMFSIGIEFSLSDLLRVKWVALLGGPLGIALSAALGAGVGALLGWPLLQGVVIGLVVSVASTMVLARLLIDRGELHSRHGRVMIGITLVEDLAVVVLTVVLPALGTLEPGRLLAIATALGKATAILAPFAWLAWMVVPRLLLRVARTGNDELFMMVALALGLGTAALTQAVGLSLALGAFLAGLLISNSDYAHETLARLLPVRDIFVAVFFVTIGCLIDPGTVLGHLPLLLGIILLVVAGKLVIWTGVVRLFGYPLTTAFLVGVGLTQIGEFSFILVQVARAAGHVGDDVYNATLAASLITILINATLVRLAPRWVERREAPPAPGAPAPHAGHVVLCGFGRIGSAVGEALDTFGLPYTVVERNPDVIRALRARGLSCIFGDAGQAAVLHAAGTEHAALVIVALPDADAAASATRAVRTLNPRAPLVARAHRTDEADELRRRGATAVVQPEMEAAASVIRQALGAMQLPSASAMAYLERFRRAMDAADPPAGEGTLPEVREVALAGGELADLSLRQAQIRERFGVTVVVIRRRDGDVVLNPSPDAVLRDGDHIRVFGLPEQIRALRVAVESA